MTQDPFASAGTPAAATFPAGKDPFGAPAKSSYPSTFNLEGCLLLITPKKTYEKTGKFGTQTYVEADTVALDGTPTGAAVLEKVYLNMFWTACTNALLPAITPGSGAEPMVLGRLRMPSRREAKVQNSSEENAEFMRKGVKPDFVYVLEHPSEDDKNTARKYLAKIATAAQAA